MAKLTRKQRRESREKAARTFARAQDKGPQFHQGSAGLFGRDAAGTSPLQSASDDFQRKRRLNQAAAAFASVPKYQAGPGYSYGGPQYSLDEYMGEADNYMAAYRSNLSKSRAQIEEQFKLAFSDTETRERISQGVVATLPGKYDAVYAGASETIDKQGASSFAAQEGMKLQSFEAAGAGGADQKAAMTASFASAKAGVPLIAAGVTSQVNRQKGALGQAKFERQGELDRAEAEMEVQYAKEQGSAKRDWMMAQQARRWSIDDRNFAAEQDRRLAWEANQGDPDNFERDRAAAREDQEWADNRARDANIDEEDRLKSQVAAGFDQNDTSLDRARAMRAANPDEYARMSNSYNLTQANKMLQGSGGNRPLISWLPFGPKRGKSDWKKGSGGGMSVDAVIKDLEKRGLYRAAAVFRMQHSRD